LRTDIQFLRGVAVLSVVLYHAKLFALEGGFLGVDVFFVISGFLITSHILKDLENNHFSFRRFYIRRAKRLLPAAYATLTITTLAGYAFLTQSEWHDYLYQLFGTVTFSANLFLPFQTGYFESSADGKPLLHTWSLSVEEQYYLVIPLLLWISSPRARGWILAFTTLASIVLCYIFVTLQFTYWRLPTIDSSTFAFYTLPARAWELLVGSMLAWLSRHHLIPAPPPILKYFALTLLTACLLHPFDGVHPRGDASLVVLATAILIAGRDDWLPTNVWTNALIKVGDWSYSLYLVHWPLFAFAYIGYLGTVPIEVRIILIPLALILAYVQYQFVEQRFRYGWHANPRRTIRWLAASTLMVFLFPLPAMLKTHALETGNTSSANSVDWVRGLNNRCGKEDSLIGSSICMTSSEPRFALWGDSYAMHLVPGLLKTPGIGDSLVQITKSSCAPILGLAAIEPPWFGESWAPSCLKFNAEAIQYIRNTTSIRYVLLSSPFDAYFRSGVLELYHDGRAWDSDRSEAIARMRKTIEAIRQAGKLPILITPPPKAGFDIGECWNRQKNGLLTLGRQDCSFGVAEFQAYQGSIIDAIADIEARDDVYVLWLDKAFCYAGHCVTGNGGRSFYRDAGHLNATGSEYLVPLLRRVANIESH
jgi:peptidoglycan/LPS O-acetylase OafA/YrhL